VIIGRDLCFQHLISDKHLKIKPSGIPDSGKGLFAVNTKKPENAIIFHKNDKIIPYTGENIPKSEIIKRYSDKTAPYGLELSQKNNIDCACMRTAGALANTSNKKSELNAFFSGNSHHALLKASKNIKNNQEILVDYGPTYKLNEKGVIFFTK
jgi:hypothetical protein